MRTDRLASGQAATIGVMLQRFCGKAHLWQRIASANIPSRVITQPGRNPDPPFAGSG
jgi:hypothetical protein